MTCLARGSKLKIPVVLEQNSVNLLSECCPAVMHQTAKYQVLCERKTWQFCLTRVLRDLQGGSKLEISVVFEQNSVNLSIERRNAVMHQTAQQQVVHEITT